MHLRASLTESLLLQNLFINDSALQIFSGCKLMFGGFQKKLKQEESEKTSHYYLPETFD
jgi:hypothetical protein